MRHIKYGLFLIILGFNPSAYCETSPRPTLLDAKIKNLPYDAGQVYKIDAYYGFILYIEYSSDETFDGKALSGDNPGWSIKPSGRHAIVIKPVDYDNTTNLIVKTKSKYGPRIYIYEMMAHLGKNLKSKKLTYYIKHTYAQYDNEIAWKEYEQTIKTEEIKQKVKDNKDGFVDPAKLNHNYYYEGDEIIRPAQTFDDGTFTFFKFNSSTPLPGIWVANGRNEEYLNYRMENGFYVVEGVNEKYTLRYQSHQGVVVKEIDYPKGMRESSSAQGHEPHKTNNSSGSDSDYYGW